ALALRGEHAAAVQLARAAVDIAEATDALLDHADARLSLAAALRAAGRDAEADVEEARAVELWEAKGATLLAGRAGRRSGRASDPTRSRHDGAAPTGTARRRVVDVDGRVLERQSDPDRIDDARARFDETVAETGETRFANLASRGQARFLQCWRNRDWHGVMATLAPIVRTDDRRPLMHLRASREEFLDGLRFLFAVPSSRWTTELMATRGDHLALFRVEVSGQVSEAGVASEEHLTLSEVDAEGRSVAIVLFAVDDVDAAYDELDRRFQASEAGTGGRAEATVTFRRAFAIRDWDLLATTLAPDVAVIDHRLLGWDTLR